MRRRNSPSLKPPGQSFEESRLRAPLPPDLDEPTEEEQQIEFITRLRLRGLSEVQISAACRRQFSIGQARTLHLLRKIVESFITQVDGNRRRARPEQIQRLKDEIREMREPREHIRHVTVREPDARGRLQIRTVEIRDRLPPPPQLARLEELLADLEGNRAPIQVDVNVRQTTAIALVIGQMAPERMQQLYDRAQQHKRLAELVEAKKGTVQ